ncbi:MAG: hypothetical protein K2I98_04390, partial [Prevotella sp.]|nr:hypothetical protein [Prevotella sp.]
KYNDWGWGKRAIHNLCIMSLAILGTPDKPKSVIRNFLHQNVIFFHKLLGALAETGWGNFFIF